MTLAELESLDAALDLELDIFAAATLLAEIQFARAKKLRPLRRLAFLADQRLAIDAWELAHRAVDVAHDAARRAARIAGQLTGAEAGLEQRILRELDADPGRSLNGDP
jgi:hypothetical protein